MQAIVMPTCPYCYARYKSGHIAEETARMERATATSAALITCPRCKEKYYIYRQQRYISRREL